MIKFRACPWRRAFGCLKAAATPWRCRSASLRSMLCEFFVASTSSRSTATFAEKRRLGRRRGEGEWRGKSGGDDDQSAQRMMNVPPPDAPCATRGGASTSREGEVGWRVGLFDRCAIVLVTSLRCRSC